MGMLDKSEITNRFGYHRATAESAPQHAKAREHFESMAQWMNEVLPPGRDLATALTHLQEAMHWSNSAIAMQNDVDTETPHLPNAPISGDAKLLDAGELVSHRVYVHTHEYEADAHCPTDCPTIPRENVIGDVHFWPKPDGGYLQKTFGTLD